jgi:hypothetical protein
MSLVTLTLGHTTLTITTSRQVFPHEYRRAMEEAEAVKKAEEEQRRAIQAAGVRRVVLCFAGCSFAWLCSMTPSKRVHLRVSHTKHALVGVIVAAARLEQYTLSSASLAPHHTTHTAPHPLRCFNARPGGRGRL